MADMDIEQNELHEILQEFYTEADESLDQPGGSAGRLAGPLFFLCRQIRKAR